MSTPDRIALAGGPEFDEERLAAALEEGHLTATDLAELMVEAGVPFRQAHRRVGRAVLLAEERGCELHELPTELLAQHVPEVDRDALAGLRPSESVPRRDTPGGPAPGRVEEQLAAARRREASLEDWAEEREPPPVLRAWRSGALTDRELPP